MMSKDSFGGKMRKRDGYWAKEVAEQVCVYRQTLTRYIVAFLDDLIEADVIKVYGIRKKRYLITDVNKFLEVLRDNGVVL